MVNQPLGMGLLSLCYVPEWASVQTQAATLVFFEIPGSESVKAF